MLTAFCFIFGTFIGSFLTVIVDRLPEGRSIIRGRSVCESCGHTLAWLDLIPILSYIFLSGKCRHCKKQFGPHYMFMEILVGFLFALTFYVTFGSDPGFFGSSVLTQAIFAIHLLIVSSLFVLFFIDLRHSIIPLSILVFLVVFGIILLILDPTRILSSFLSGVGAFLFFLLIYIITKGKGMGFGDVLLAFVMGILLGFPGIIVAIYIAFLTGLVISLILILRGKKKLKSVIPFGPFLAFGTFLCLLWGPSLTHIFLVLLRIV